MLSVELLDWKSTIRMKMWGNVRLLEWNHSKTSLSQFMKGMLVISTTMKCLGVNGGSCSGGIREAITWNFMWKLLIPGKLVQWTMSTYTAFWGSRHLREYDEGVGTIPIRNVSPWIQNSRSSCKNIRRGWLPLPGWYARPSGLNIHISVQPRSSKAWSPWLEEPPESAAHAYPL